MPTYEYQCKACDHEFELFQPMSASPKRKCPKCGRMTLKRLIGTGSAVIFKGSGFYQTDYRSESYKKAAKAEAANGQAKTSSDTKKESTSKPAVKTETKPAKATAE